MILQVPDSADPLAQGDIIDNVPIFIRIDADTADTNRTRVIALTQTCDFAQSKTGKVLVACVYSAQEMVDQQRIKPSAIRDQVRHGRMFGMYFLPAEPEINFPELLVDLRDVHTVPLSLLDDLRLAGKRPATLPSPYREHLAQHFALTYMRIALPVPSETMPF